MEKLFKADWKLEEFHNLIEAGLKMGSKYFFLVGCAHGLYFMVRDTDSEGLDSNPTRFPNEVYEVFAEGFERELGVEELNEKVAELYKGDICQWFRLSEQLLLVIKNKISEGYTKLRMLSNPLVLDKEHQNPNQPEAFIVHGIAIFGGGSCPVDAFSADIDFQLVNGTEMKELPKIYCGRKMFIDKKEAEIINLQIKIKNKTADINSCFQMMEELEKNKKFYELTQTQIFLKENGAVNPKYNFEFYSQLAQTQLYAEDHHASLDSSLKALSYREEDLPTLSNIANRYRDIGQIEKSLSYYEKALSIDSGDPILQSNFKRLNRIANFKLISISSFYESLLFHHTIRKDGVIGEITYKKYQYNDATEEMLDHLLYLVDPDILQYIPDNFEYLNHLYNKFSQIETCKAFFENVLDCDLKEGKLDEWNIGKNASYSDIQSLLEAVDWDYIKFIFNRSWSDACDEFRMSYIKKMI